MGNACDMRISSSITTPARAKSESKKPWDVTIGFQIKQHCYDIPSSCCQNTLLLASSVYQQIMEYFEPIYQHYLLTLPLSRAYRQQTALVPELWNALLQESPFSLITPTMITSRLVKYATNKKQHCISDKSSVVVVVSDIHSRFDFVDWKYTVKPLHLALSQADHYLDQKIISIPTITKLMATVRCCSKLEMKALQVLVKLINCEWTRTLAQQSDIPSLVFKIMKDNKEDDSLLSLCLYTMMLILRPLGGSEGCLFKGDEMSSVKLDCVCDYGIKIVLDTMRHHLKSAEIQHMGCWALVNLALESEHKKVLLQQDAIGVICDALVEHSSNEQVIFRALFGLINLVTVSHISTRIKSKETIKSLAVKVVNSTFKFLSDKDIAGRGCMVLYNLSLDEANHNLLIELEVPRLLKEAARLHPKYDLLAHVARSTMTRLT